MTTKTLRTTTRITQEMPSVPALFKATLTLKCLSFQFVTVTKITLLDRRQDQLVVIVLAKTYDGNKEIVPMPLTPGLAYNEVLIYRTTEDGLEIGEPFRIDINYQEQERGELSSERGTTVDEVESREGNV